MNLRNLKRMFLANNAKKKADKKRGYSLSESQTFTLYGIDLSIGEFGFCTIGRVHYLMAQHGHTKSRNTIQKELVSLEELGLIRVDKNHKTHRLHILFAGKNLLIDMEYALRTTRFAKPKK